MLISKPLIGAAFGFAWAFASATGASGAGAAARQADGAWLVRTLST